ncbi:cation transporter [uncultured Secundilactobacillus sp.]|uniref:cation transporter n=1 Tax=uncultured Secundilactobacillus sp. TaxID=2813935 RepID=UPI00258917CF|nr:cation transporter [uncultured Secundilactobacillus sp.]
MTNSGQAKLVTKSLTIEYLSVGWMTFEFLVGFWSGLKASSILLIAFGLDSLLEIISGGALIWRLKKEANGAGQPEIERAEQRSARIVGSVLLLLAAYVTIVSIINLVTHAAADTSFSGMAIAVASVILMPILTIQKRRLGQALHSPALIEDGLCNITCAYMAATVLIGAILTALFGWWWADSLAALVLVYFIASEGWEAFSGD